MTKIFKWILLVLIIMTFLGCSTSATYTYLNDEERNQIESIAMLYEGIPYEWGGQSFYYEENPTVDCSGFVINVYKDVIKRSQKELLFDDTTVKYLYYNFSDTTTNWQKGDLVFFRMEEIGPPTHIGILLSIDSEEIKFIDASSLSDIMKVSVRTYEISNPKILDIKKMRLKLKE